MLSPNDKLLLELVWKSSTMDEVVKGMTLALKGKKNPKLWITNRMTKLRKAGVPLKYFKDSGKVNVGECVSFLNSLGISAEDQQNALSQAGVEPSAKKKVKR